MTRYQPVYIYYILNCPKCNAGHGFHNGRDFIINDKNEVNWILKDFNCRDCNEPLITPTNIGDGNYSYGAFCMYCGDFRYWGKEVDDPLKCPECNLVMFNANDESEVVAIAKSIFVSTTVFFKKILCGFDKS